MTIDDIKGIVRRFIARKIARQHLADDDDIFALGFGNSLFAMELLEFVEHQFDVRIEDDDLDVDHFKTVGNIASLVTRKLDAVQAPSAP